MLSSFNRSTLFGSKPAAVLLAGALIFSSQIAFAGKLKPFVLASENAGSIADAVATTKTVLTGNGFEVVGEYAPYKTAALVVVTNSELKKIAKGTEHGGYGAVLRVAISKVGDQVQVSYTDPTYWHNAFRLQGNPSKVAAAMKAALGAKSTFGAEGLTLREVRKFHYMFGMPYFDDPLELADYSNYKEAVAAVEKGLAAGKGNAKKVYRVDIPGKQETVFGVSLGGSDCSGDKYIMSRIDKRAPQSTAHLPYEILVSGDEIYALHAKFRIAISFPDLPMIADPKGTFMDIMCAPGAIEDALELAVAN